MVGMRWPVPKGVLHFEVLHPPPSPVTSSPTPPPPKSKEKEQTSKCSALAAKVRI